MKKTTHPAYRAYPVSIGKRYASQPTHAVVDENVDALSLKEQEVLYDEMRSLVERFGTANVEASLVNVLANP